MKMSNNAGSFGDTALTKVFVGGLAWETPKEALREHFGKYGEILEAVVISDKLTGRSKGYGFVTFKEAKAAKKACEDATPMINGRRANCNIAALGARRANNSSTPPPQQEANAVLRSTSMAAANPVQWYYVGRTPGLPFQQQHHPQAMPIYGYSPTYVAPDLSYNHKVGYTGGSYMNRHFSQVYPAQPMMAMNAGMPMYPVYQYPHSQELGLEAQFFSPATGGLITTVPAFMSRPASMPPKRGAVGEAENIKKVA